MNPVMLAQNYHHQGKPVGEVGRPAEAQGQGDTACRIYDISPVSFSISEEEIM